MTRTLAGTTIVALLVVILAAGCSSALQATAPAETTAAGSAGPTATLTQPQQLVFGEELFNFGCVCHPTEQKGAPPVSEIESVPTSTVQQTVRQGKEAMPMFDTTQLSDNWLTLITNYLQAVHQGTPVPTVSP